MGAQLTLFDLGDSAGLELSGKSDPPTSAAAASEHVASGKRAANAALVWAIVRALPGSTSVEIFDAQPQGADWLDRHEISRRLADLMHAGMVRQGPARECRVKRRKMVTWEAL